MTLVYLNKNMVTIKIYIPSKAVIFHMNLHVHALAGKISIIDNALHIVIVIFIHTYTMHKFKY